MARFIRKVVLYVLCIILLTVLIYVIMLSVSNKECWYSHEMNVVRSIEKLRVEQSPKIVFIGGSGLAFGLKSEKVQEFFGMPTYNTGTHGGLGLRLQVALFEEFINKGDIVVCVPEYQQFLGDFAYGNETALRILSSTYPQGYEHVTLKQHLYLLRYAPDVFRSALSSRNAEPYGGPYAVSALNGYGDVECYEFRGHVEGIPVGKLDGDLQKQAFSILKDLDEYCSKCEATFLVFPPAFRQEAYEVNKSIINRIWTMLCDSGLPVVSCPQTYSFPDSLFYDTDYHLTKAGADYRTNMIIMDINYALQFH